MSKPVKELIMKTYADKFDGVTDAMIVDIRGIEANDNNAFRNGLAEKEIRVSVVKNSLARKAFEGTDLAPINDMIDGPSAVIYGGESAVSIAREILEWVDKLKGIDVKGAVMEGTVFGADEIERLSKFPTKDEAISQAVTLLISPHQNVVGAAAGPGGAIASLLSAIEEKLEKGEEIAKVG